MRLIRGLLVGVFAFQMTACDQLDAVSVGATPAPRPPLLVEPTPESAEAAAYYARVEEGQRARGLLRIDGGGPDVPFDADRLGNTFLDLAFAREFSDVGQSLVRQETDSKLHRWASPVRLQPIFGPSVIEMQRGDDREAIKRFANRLARVTNHPVEYADRGGNFFVLILSEDERRVSGPLLQRLIPGVRDREIEIIQNLDRATYCVVLASDPKDDGVITRAVAVIRSELPPRLRQSCIHEELAQGLGLANDSARARPSIFNDDDEFGRLTAMDEMMLGILYDLRLQPGAAKPDATPTVLGIARGMMGDTS